MVAGEDREMDWLKNDFLNVVEVNNNKRINIQTFTFFTASPQQAKGMAIKKTYGKVRARMETIQLLTGLTKPLTQEATNRIETAMPVSESIHSKNFFISNSMVQGKKIVGCNDTGKS